MRNSNIKFLIYLSEKHYFLSRNHIHYKLDKNYMLIKRAKTMNQGREKRSWWLSIKQYKEKQNHDRKWKKLKKKQYKNSQSKMKEHFHKPVRSRNTRFPRIEGITRFQRIEENTRKQKSGKTIWMKGLLAIPNAPDKPLDNSITTRSQTFLAWFMSLFLVSTSTSTYFSHKVWFL